VNIGNRALQIYPPRFDDGQVDSVRGRSNVMDTAQQFLFEIMG